MVLGGGLPGRVGSCRFFNSRNEVKAEEDLTFLGRLAQLGERLPYKQDVIGSSPIVSIGTIIIGIMGQRGSIGRAADL